MHRWVLYVNSTVGLAKYITIFKRNKLSVKDHKNTILCNFKKKRCGELDSISEKENDINAVQTAANRPNDG